MSKIWKPLLKTKFILTTLRSYPLLNKKFLTTLKSAGEKVLLFLISLEMSGFCSKFDKLLALPKQLSGCVVELLYAHLKSISGLSAPVGSSRFDMAWLEWNFLSSIRGDGWGDSELGLIK